MQYIVPTYSSSYIMYNNIIVTETTEEAKKPQNKSKGKNLTPTAIF